jgi:hypothetical protein
LWLLGAAIFGWVPIQVGVIASVALGTAGVLRDSGLLRFKLPENRRLIPQDVLNGWLLPAHLQFGFEMGTGVRTYVPATAPYVLGVAVLLSNVSLVHAVLVGVLFGLGRLAIVLSRLLSGAEGDWDRRLNKAARPMATLMTLGTSAAIVAAMALR